MPDPTPTKLEREAYEALYRQTSNQIRAIFRDDSGIAHDWLRFASVQDIYTKIDEALTLREKLNEVGKKLNYKPL